MKRFRFTLLAICLVLIFLGWTEISYFLRNRVPLAVTITELEQGAETREWLHITGGSLDLLGAISTSGSIELDALLIPLKSDPAAPGFQVLVESRDPALLDLFGTYHFRQDSETEQQRFLEENRERFTIRRDLTGTKVGGLIASGNRDKLVKLTQELGTPVAENILFVSEGKEPGKWRGFFFFGVGLLGLLKVLLKWPKVSPPESV
jgi:hypothetical protein